MECKNWLNLYLKCIVSHFEKHISGTVNVECVSIITDGLIKAVPENEDINSWDCKSCRTIVVMSSELPDKEQGQKPQTWGQFLLIPFRSATAEREMMKFLGLWWAETAIEREEDYEIKQKKS